MRKRAPPALDLELADALAREAATSEILRVISQSRDDVRPVFEAIARSALMLCHASSSVVATYDGELLHIGGLASTTAEGADAIRAIFPRPASRDNGVTRAVLTADTVQIPDVLQEPEYATAAPSIAAGFRSVLAVPLLRDGKPIGAISVGRTDTGAFPDAHAALLQTFAHQAAIAINHATLFRATQQSLEQQTATSEILRVISSSQTDVEPVFDAIVRDGTRLCDAAFAAAFRYDGKVMTFVAHHNMSPAEVEVMASLFPRAAQPDTATGRAVIGRQAIHIHDIREDASYGASSLQKALGFRTVLAVPILRNGEPIGALGLWRRVVEPFTDRHIRLMSVFADQAVIAIENVRLFTEVEARNRDLTEALDQQTATSDILRVISQSPNDVQPVFDLLAQHAGKLCDAEVAVISRLDGDMIELAAIGGVVPEAVAIVRALYPMRLDAETVTARTIRGATLVHTADVLQDPSYGIRQFALAAQYRAGLGVPIVRDSRVIGSIFVGRSVPGLFADSEVELIKTFADQAVIAIENVRLFTELDARNRDLTEALEQQTATTDILQVISRSPTDVQPVFDTIAASALTLCRAASVLVTRVDGDNVALVASANLTAEGAAAMQQVFPMPISRKSTSARALLERRIVTIPDVLADEDYEVTDLALRARFRSTVAVPLVRDGQPFGTITVGKPDAGAFPESQVTLLQTFAKQAAIAVENVRLFTELEARNRDLTEALEHQMATSDILRVIARSPSDVQPVFDTIGERAARLCDADVAVVSHLDGDMLQLVALHGVSETARSSVARYFPMRLDAEATSARAVRSRSVVNIPDVLADPLYAPKDAARLAEWRAGAAVPMFRGGDVIGAIFVGRKKTGPLPEPKVQLLKTFADQAVIAVENVRLFKELEQRNGDLSEALEQQTATSEILRVISQAQTDVQPVFDTIVNSVLGLCDAAHSGVYLLEGDALSLAATAGLTAEVRHAFAAGYPRKVGPDTVSGRAAIECRTVQSADLMADPDYAGAPGTRVGARTVLAVPLVRDGRAIGSIGVWRSEPKLFSDTQIALLQTFADQAVIAIENVRLFTELEARTGQLMRSVGELRALGEVGRAVSSTLDLGTVLSTIVSQATALTGMDAGSIYEYDEAKEEYFLHSSHGVPPEIETALRATPMRKGEGALGRTALTRQPVEFPDVGDESSYQSHVRDLLVKRGFRALLVVPLLREDHLLGGLAVNRRAPGPFDPQVIALLQTFATQSAIAIHNARLFREIEIKSRELETASRHKSEFLANMSHELRTPLNAIIGFSDVLDERLFGELNPKQAEYVADIADSGRHLLALINDILDLSKIEAGRMELDVSEFDLRKSVLQTLSLVRERAERRGITLQTRIDDAVGALRADERKVKQVLLNLLSNALKFTPEGGTVAVAVVRSPDRVEVAVTDTGVGIAPEDQDAVFEEFRQVGANAARVEGTGLGLAISRKFIELHGGHIGVQSEVGKGSTFAFWLPAAADQ